MWFYLDIPRPTFVYLLWIPVGPSKCQRQMTYSHYTLDYLCKWLAILNNVYLPLIRLLLFCGQDPCPLTLPILLGLLQHRKGHPFYCLLVSIQSSLRWTGLLFGSVGDVSESWVLVSLSSLNTLIIYSGLSHCCSTDGEESSTD